MLILQLPHYGVGGADWEANMAQRGAREVGALDPAVQDDGLFAILGQEGDGDAGHDSLLFLSVHCHATNFQRWGQVTFVIEGDRRGGGLAGGLESREIPARLLVQEIVRQKRMEKVDKFSAVGAASEGNRQKLKP
jgi:hypothetical protein